VCAAFVLGTAARVRDFASDERLFEEELRRTPDYVEGLAALARARDRAGRYREAEPYWRSALAPHPGRISYANYDVLVVDYAYNLLAQDRPREAYELLLSHQHLVTTARGREELRYRVNSLRGCWAYAPPAEGRATSPRRAPWLGASMSANRASGNSTPGWS
jgi:hypothetical protein